MDFFQKPNTLDEIDEYCQNRAWDQIWLFVNIFVLVVGGMGNGILFWLLHREMKSNSASKVLGLNLVAMDFMFISFLPFACVFDPYMSVTNATETKLIYHTSNNVSENVFGMFNVIGCPLLLSCMCIERYLAVVRPVLYLKARKWEYRVAVSSAVWLVTFSFCLASGIINDLSVMLGPVCIVISCLFYVMFASLMGVVLSLRQQSPAYTSSNQAGSPLKRRAVVNVLTVVVPAVIAYTPVGFMLPVLFLTIYDRLAQSRLACVAYQFCQMFPRLGVLIGPFFYLAKAKQIFCLTGKMSSARGIVS